VYRDNGSFFFTSGIHKRSDKLRCDLGHNCVAISAESRHSIALCQLEQSGRVLPSNTCWINSQAFQPGQQESHAAGNPRSQRLNAGSNTPGLAISAVGNPKIGANITACSLSGLLLRSIVSWLVRPSRQSLVQGVAHGAPFVTLASSRSAPISVVQFVPALGDGHPVQALSDVRRTNAVCAQYAMPDGVAFSFHVCLYSVKPPVPNRVFNLLTKAHVRATLANEAEELRPEVA
jgi:hypothetical protein